MYLVAFTFMFVHVCACTYMRAQLDPAVQVYRGRSKRSYHVCWLATLSLKLKMRPYKLGGCHFAHFHIWYIFMYVREYTPILLVNRMNMKTTGGYTYVFLSIKYTF